MVEAIQYVFIFFMFTALISRVSAKPKVVFLDKSSETTAIETKDINEITQERIEPTLSSKKELIERIEPIVPSIDDFDIDTIGDLYATEDPRMAGIMSEVLDLKKGDSPMAVRVNPYRDIFGLQAMRRQLINRLNNAYRCPRVISH